LAVFQIVGEKLRDASADNVLLTSNGTHTGEHRLWAAFDL
jgi:hypothetical protein